MTLADVEAVSPETLTPWKEELLWRLYVDTYNYLTLQYGDDLIERTPGGRRRVRRRAGRPISPAERGRRLSRGAAAALPAAVRSARDLRSTCGWRATSIPTRCTCGSSRRRSAWQLTVVTLDKPMLFANICGVLSSFGMDILRGHAMTNPNGLVLDVVPVHRQRAVPRAQPRRARRAMLHALEDVVAGRSTSPTGCAAGEQGCGAAAAAPVAPIVHADGEASRRYTVLEIIAPDELGLLYRISRGDRDRRAATSTWS